MQSPTQAEAILDTVRMRDALGGLADQRGKIVRWLLRHAEKTHLIQSETTP